MAGGMWEGPYETDRATMKESCTVWDENDEETLCDFRKIGYMGGDWGCDQDCQPFGGVWDPTGGLDGWGGCDWGEDFENCPEGWTRMATRYTEMGQEDYLTCDVYCLGTGGEYVTVSDEWGDEY